MPLLHVRELLAFTAHTGNAGGLRSVLSPFYRR
jgi:hypothetical protein